MASESAYPLEVSVHNARELLQNRAGSCRVIDVREPHEWQICHIEGAQHIPMRQIPEVAGDLPRDEHLLICCHHGGRSLRVTQYLRSLGFDAVTNIAGGVDAWSREIDPSLLRY